MSISEWFKRSEKEIQVDPKNQKKDLPTGVWVKCEKCAETVFNKEFLRNQKVCPRCDHHYMIGAYERISGMIDDNVFEEMDADLGSYNILNFAASKNYSKVIEESQDKTGLKDAVICVTGSLDGKKVVLVAMDFRFAGGSMGSVVGEKITRATERATEEGIPLIIFSASGGARIQEGMFSLMQMAKTSAAIGRHLEKNLPYISILTNPTTGGVLASFAALAPIIIAEPKALIGFAGKRVIEQTIKQKLPDNFQSAEFLVEQGMIDAIVDRRRIKEYISELI